MKLKTYFTPKVVRVIAVSLLALVLVYTAVTMLDVLRPAGAPQEKMPQKEMSSPPPLPLSPKMAAEQQAKAQEENKAAARAEAENLAQEAQKSAEERKIAEQKAAAAKEEMTEAVQKTINDCRDENKTWYACKTDKECVDIIGACGGRDAANREFRTEVQNCNRAAAASLKCDPFTQWRSIPRCIEGVCVAQKQEAKPASKTP